jgi:uncharacterized membrane protein
MNWTSPFNWVHAQLKKALDFLGEIDTELSEGKEIRAFAKFLGFTILVMIIISSIIFGIGRLLLSTDNLFMKLVAAVLIILFLVVIVCIIRFLWKKFLKDKGSNRNQ